MAVDPSSGAPLPSSGQQSDRDPHWQPPAQPPTCWPDPGRGVAAIFGSGARRGGNWRPSAPCGPSSVFVYSLAGPRSSRVEMAGDGPIQPTFASPPPRARALAKTDVVCTATTALTPVFDGHDLRPGTHVNGIGSFTPEMQEIDLATVRRSRVGLSTRSGPRWPRRAICSFPSTPEIPDHISTELGEVIDGSKPGRTSTGQITFSSRSASPCRMPWPPVSFCWRPNAGTGNDYRTMSILPPSASVVVVGGGVMGASTAYHLALRGVRDVVLLESQPFFGQGHRQCAGGIRYQFSTAINVRLSTEPAMLARFEAETGQPSTCATTATCCWRPQRTTWPSSGATWRCNTTWACPRVTERRWCGGACFWRPATCWRLSPSTPATGWPTNGVVAGYISAGRRLRARLQRRAGDGHRGRARSRSGRVTPLGRVACERSSTPPGRGRPDRRHGRRLVAYHARPPPDADHHSLARSGPGTVCDRLRPQLTSIARAKGY